MSNVGTFGRKLGLAFDFGFVWGQMRPALWFCVAPDATQETLGLWGNMASHELHQSEKTLEIAGKIEAFSVSH